MAFTARCTSCGSITLTVWASGDERRCLECVERLEFLPGPGRSLQGFIRWRVLRDDRLEDRSSPVPVEDVPHLVLDDVVPSVDVGGVEPGCQLLPESSRV